jgi:hypothetical protein
MRVFSQLLVWVVGVRLHDIFSPHWLLFTGCFETFHYTFHHTGFFLLDALRLFTTLFTTLASFYWML